MANKDNRKPFKGKSGKAFSDTVEDDRAHWETYAQAAKRIAERHERKWKKRKRKLQKIRSETSKMEVNPGVKREGES